MTAKYDLTVHSPAGTLVGDLVLDGSVELHGGLGLGPAASHVWPLLLLPKWFSFIGPSASYCMLGARDPRGCRGEVQCDAIRDGQVQVLPKTGEATSFWPP